MSKGIIFDCYEIAMPLRAVIGQDPVLVAEQHIKVLVALLQLNMIWIDQITGAVEINYVDDLTVQEMKYINKNSILRKIIET